MWLWLGLTLAAPLTPSSTLATPKWKEGDVTVHVILQSHERAIGGTNPRAAACQQAILDTVKAHVQRRGATAVITEGRVMQGTVEDAQALGPGNRKGHASDQLPTVEGVTVYGMERRDEHAFAMARLEGMDDATNAMRELVDAKMSDADKLKRLAELKADMAEVTTEFAIASVPMRSYHALQTALDVASDHDLEHVFIVIGRMHGPDFVHAIDSADRIGGGTYVRMKLNTYRCE